MWTVVLAGCREAPQPVDVEVCDATETVELEAVPTWSDDVAPIVAEHCATCHVPGGIGPMPLDGYEAASPWAEAMAAAVQARRMPPFPPRNCGSCNLFREARWLEPDEVATIVAWAEGDAPGGDEDAPFPRAELLPVLEDGGVTLRIPAYTPDASVDDDYRCFVLDPGRGTDAFVTGFDVHPGDDREVHHVIAYAVTSEGDDAAALAKDAAEEGPGYTCYGGTGLSGTTMVAGWAPGGGATVFPDGTGLPLRAGGLMVVQIHYNTAQGVFEDDTEVELSLADAVERPAQIVSVSANDELSLAPGRSEVAVTHTETFAAGTVWGAAGHMHTRGSSMRVVSADGTCLLDIPEWDFHWQGLYMYASPISSDVPVEVTVTCTYDTSDDTEVVSWGEGTDEEMCIGFLYVTSP